MDEALIAWACVLVVFFVFEFLGDSIDLGFYLWQSLALAWVAVNNLAFGNRLRIAQRRNKALTTEIAALNQTLHELRNLPTT